MLIFILLTSSRILSRFNLWTQSVLVLSRIRPSTRLDSNFRLRFSYFCLIRKDSPRIRRAFAGILRRDLDISAANNLWLAFTAWCLGCFRLAELINKRTARLNSGTPEAVMATREAEFAASLLNGSLAGTLSDLVEHLGIPATTTEPLIVVPFSGQYGKLFDLWKQQVDHHAKGRLVVLVMDEWAKRIVKESSVRDVVDLSPYFGFDQTGSVDDFSKRHLWVLRVLVLKELISRGHTVISLDLDAVLVGDLSQMLEALPVSDIVAQRDYSIPLDVAHELGFIICCGFMLIRSNPAIIGFMSRYAAQVTLEFDDQTALNHLLVEATVQNQTSTNSYMVFDSGGVSWVCPDTSLVSRDVSYGTIIRHFQQQGQSIDDLRRSLGLVRSS